MEMDMGMNMDVHNSDIGPAYYTVLLFCNYDYIAIAIMSLCKSMTACNYAKIVRKLRAFVIRLKLPITSRRK
jgi:hypothetical protein